MPDTGLFNNVYNPDVLSCLANLSNDEVFTPPEVVNQMLDMLPKELFENPDTTFLDPACKTGVFLREIAKRLIVGLEPQYPDLQERIDHIFQKQLFGIAITELTSLLSRRGVYCSKYPNSEFSVCKFDDAQGNIRYKRILHTWGKITYDKDNKPKATCIFCGASMGQYERGDELETHAYELIHAEKPEEIWNMKFDVIIGNPPYQLSTTIESAQATPLYDKFVIQATKLQPRYISMIIPARWYAGGMGLDQFRDYMLSSHKLAKMIDFPNTGDCFPGIELRGGVCYFLWDRSYNGECEFKSISNENISTMKRNLSEYSIFIRWNQALSIVKKIETFNEESLSKIVSAVSPFGISTTISFSDEKTANTSYRVFTSKGEKYVSMSNIISGHDKLNKYKVLISQLISGNLETPPFKVLSRIEVMNKGDVCTHTYITAGCFDTIDEANNLYEYIKTKFARFLLLLSVSNMHISKDKFRFVPIQDFTHKWSDRDLYEKYNLSDEEISFIESMIRPFDGGDK